MAIRSDPRTASRSRPSRLPSRTRPRGRRRSHGLPGRGSAGNRARRSPLLSLEQALPATEPSARRADLLAQHQVVSDPVRAVHRARDIAGVEMRLDARARERGCARRHAPACRRRSRAARAPPRPGVLPGRLAPGTRRHPARLAVKVLTASATSSACMRVNLAGSVRSSARRRQPQPTSPTWTCWSAGARAARRNPGLELTGKSVGGRRRDRANRMPVAMSREAATCCALWPA